MGKFELVILALLAGFFVFGFMVGVEYQALQKSVDTELREFEVRDWHEATSILCNGNGKCWWMRRERDAGVDRL